MGIFWFEFDILNIMKIATYNLEFLFDEGTRKHSGKDYFFSKEFTQKRVDYFSKKFDEIGADVLFLQELGSESVLKKVLQKMKNKYNFFIAKPDGFGVGNAVIYKDKSCVCVSVPAKAAMPVFVENDKDIVGNRIWSRRDYVHLRTSLAGKEFNLLGIHIKSNFLIPEKTMEGEQKTIKTQIGVVDGRIRSELFRFSQAKKAREMVDTFFVQDPNAYVVVLGDFNAQSISSVYCMVQGEIKKYDDSLIAVADRIPEEERFSLIGPSYSSLIDHILVSKALESKVQSLEIKNKDIYNHSCDEKAPFIVESDHAPVIMQIN